MAKDPNIDGWDEKNNQEDNNQDWGWEKKVTFTQEQFESIKKSNQEAQKLIKQFQKEKSEREELDKKAEQRKLEEKGEFEKLKTSRASEKEEFVSSSKLKDETLANQTSFIKELADKQLDGLKEKLWDNYKDIESLIDLENPMEVLKKLPTITNLLVKQEKTPKGDNGTPKWNSPDRLNTLREKARKGELSRSEETEFRKLISKKD